MKLVRLLIIGGVLAVLHQADATTRYVWTNSPAPAAPYTNWHTAAHVIQDAVDAAVAGDTVLVTNGVYETGGRNAIGYITTNRVYVDKAISLASVNGPDVTIIRGVWPSGPGAVRCAYLGSDSQMTGFTLTGGGCVGSGYSDDFAGGGVLCKENVTITGCIISSNGAAEGGFSSAWGGGIYGGTLKNCTISKNRASSGGGSFDSILSNCRLYENYAYYDGGGSCGGALTDCILVGNTSSGRGSGVHACLIRHCDLYLNQSEVGGQVSYGMAENCIVWGSTGTVSEMVETQVDHCWTNDPHYVNPVAGDFRLLPTSPCIDAGVFIQGTQTDPDGNTRPYDGNCDGVATVDIGAYEYVAQSRYVSPLGAAIPPYTNWATAATRIQDAVNVAEANDTLLIAPGTYGPASGSADGTNLVLIDKPLTLRSSGNAKDTILDGGGSLRGVRMTVASSLIGLTIQNCRVADGGAGIVASAGGYIDSCVVADNVAEDGHGGGINMVGGTVQNCLIVGNIASNAQNLRDGGGVFSYGTTLNHCTVVDNTCGRNGAGVYQDRRANTDNIIQNSIVYDNHGTNADIIAANSGGSGAVIQAYSCSPGLTSGSGNISAGPAFQNALTGNFRLLSTSPCVDAGDATVGAATVSDLEGYPRPFDGNGDGVSGWDMGAFEYMQPSQSGTHYVWLHGGNIAPYTNWQSAAVTIQAAIDAAAPGDRIMVMDGEYSEGGKPAQGGLRGTRAYVDKALTIISVNGADATFIDGSAIWWPEAPCRAAYLASNACMSGFTLWKCDVGGEDGGGAYCEGGASLVDCVVVSNKAVNGGGIYTETGVLVDHCIIRNNNINNGVGAALYGGATVRNCLIASNDTSGTTYRLGGGIYGAQLVENCTSDGNGTWLSSNVGIAANEVRNCIATDGLSVPSPGGISENNFTGNPTFTNGYRLMAGSPCIDAGKSRDWAAGGLDLGGLPRVSGAAIDIGCYEYYPTGALVAVFSTFPTQACVETPVPYTIEITGAPLVHVWDFGDGTLATNLYDATHAYTVTGLYQIVVSVSNLTMSVAATQWIQIVDHRYYYVATNGNDAFDGLSWSNAKATLGGAITAADTIGATIWVSNGVYGAPPMSTDSCVVIDRQLVVQSVGGADVTSIEGSILRRGVYLMDRTRLEGFTVRGGSPRGNGGGVLCESSNEIISNCVIVNNSALGLDGSSGFMKGDGGGVWGGTVWRSRIIGNWAMRGGGASSAILHECDIQSNRVDRHGSTWGGSGVHTSFVYNSLIAGNEGISTADNNYYAAPAYNSILYNCTVVSNHSTEDAGNMFEVTKLIAAYEGTYYNSICVGETRTNAVLITCYTNGNPGFVDAVGGDYRLLADSACVDAGNNQYVVGGETDLDGSPRIVNGQVDLGAYEFTSQNVADGNSNGIPNEWELRYFGGTNNCNANADSDGDGLSNWAEWRAGTDPTNATSIFEFRDIAASTNGGRAFSWPSRSNRFYSVWYSSSLTSPSGFALLEDNIVGVPPMNTYTDTVHAADAHTFYRVRVND